MKPTSIDLFAGVGGLTLGFQAAGIHTTHAIDIEKSCAEVFPNNFPDVQFIQKSVADFSDTEIEHLAPDGVDVVAGGPPCQGFSLIGLRDPDDDRSKLIFEFRRYVNILRPKYFVMENVPGMLSAEKGKWVQTLISQLEADGYNIADPKILNATEFGVPQERRRVFLLGTRKDIYSHLDVPTPTHWSPRKRKGLINIPEGREKFVSVQEAISDLPDIEKHDYLIEGHKTPYDKHPTSDYARMMRGVGSYRSFFGNPNRNWDPTTCTNCKRIVHGEVLRQRFRETSPGETVPVSRLFKLDWNDVANTLRAGTPSSRGSYSSPRPVHPEELRCISVREGARLQGFPDWFEFHSTKWHGFRQVGNSVSPLVAKAVGQKIVAAIDSNSQILENFPSAKRALIA
ncbi:DNA cytosine methyltransferase [Sulfitobacter sp. D7]|jgi:DNA (cytosine-5)-methyltransferase 1|uniref:DNA cytosine methyltransferase n=1 Tax=Sulfitobacter sp. D7 TaxID=1968541 RepID=UPI0013C476A3|nr:DNA cytosine methyltransferase [Sulfitobacter sp. D7]